MFIEMELSEIQMSEGVNHPQVIILSEKGGSRTFPIFIGFFEASAMEFSIKGYKNPRPMTHDLIFNILEACDLKLVRVLVDELRNDTFFGKLAIQNNQGEEVFVDTRPSDAIVLASKRNIPIFVHEDVLNQVSGPGEEEQEQEEEGELPEDSL
jgi:hypothetical protein